MKKIAEAILLLLFFFCSGKNLFSSSEEFDRRFYGIFHRIYNFEFHQADSLISELKKEYPEEARIYVLGTNYYWWKIRSGENSEENKKKLLQQVVLSKTLLDKKNSSSTNQDPGGKSLTNEDIFDYIHLYAYSARCELLENNYFKALTYLDKCMGFLKLSFGNESKFESFKLTSGLYNFFISEAKKKSPLLAPFMVFLPEANRIKGIKYLLECAKSNDAVLRTEGNYFLMFIFNEHENCSMISEKYALLLCKNHPKNLLYQHYLFSVLLAQGKEDEAEKQLETLRIAGINNRELCAAQKNYYFEKAKEDIRKYKKGGLKKTEN